MLAAHRRILDRRKRCALDGLDPLASAPHIARMTEDNGLFDAAERLAAAHHAFQAAAIELARAERKLARMAPTPDVPTWFVAYEEAEASAGVGMEALYEQIAEIRAHSKAGLAVKLRILAALYREDPTPVRDVYEIDVASRLLRSIVEDVSDNRDQPNLPF